MKIYLAGPWVDRVTAKALAAKLEAHGHTITHPWWEYEGEWEDVEKMKECAKLDVFGVMSADAMVLINSVKSEGKAVEQGIAIAVDMPIYALGEANFFNIFQRLDNYQWFTNEEDLINALRG